MFNNNSFLSSIPTVTKNIIIINVLCWIASLTLPDILLKTFHIDFDVIHYLGLHYWDAKDFFLFQPITYMFLHDTSSISHLFFNMFSLFMFGRIVEQLWGPKRFLIYYILTGVGAAIVQEAVWSYTFFTELGDQYVDYLPSLNNAITIGASGSVFGILLAFGMLFPNAPIFLMFIPIPIKAKYMVIGYGVIELFLGVNPTMGGNVAHFAHLGGMLFGFILIRKWKRDSNGKHPF